MMRLTEWLYFGRKHVLTVLNILFRIKCSLIKREEIIINENEVDEDGNLTIPIYKSIGKYVLTPDGEYYIDYRKTKIEVNLEHGLL